MADVFSKRKRSQIMSRVKGGGNTATELKLIKLFRLNHITGWRRNYPLLGRPDFVFPAERLSVFVDGCFWHGCPIHKSRPLTNPVFWRQKLEKNKVRDRFVARALKARGWRVIRIWQHELRKSRQVIRRISRILG